MCKAFYEIAKVLPYIFQVENLSELDINDVSISFYEYKRKKTTL